MELIRKSLPVKVKEFFSKISQDNLFLLSSSVSYYSALAIAPFLLILLAVAAFMGGDVQNEIIRMTADFSPEVGKMITIIFNNVNEGVNFRSLSGILGGIVLLSTASLVFLQLRYALDVIYGHHHIYSSKSIWDTILEKLFAMLVVLIAGVFLIVTSSLPGLIRTFLGDNKNLLFYSAFIINFFIYVCMFWGIHYFVPSARPGKRDALRMSLLSSVFFILGNILLSSYLKSIAVSSIYGAAGTLLIFLIWTYYSSFTMFLSVEVFLYLRKLRKQ